MPMLRPLNPESQRVGDPEFNVISDVPVTCIDTIHLRERDVNPTTVSTSAEAPIEFRFDTAPDEWIRWRDTLLSIKLELELSRSVATNTTAITKTDWDNVVPAQNLIHSLFKSVDLSINQKELSVAPQSYAYQAYLTNLLTTTANCKDTFLQLAGYFTDETKRKAYCKPSTNEPSKMEIELQDFLHVCFAEQTKSLIGGLRFVMRLIPNDPAFYFQIKGDYKLTIKFKDPILRLRMPVTNNNLTQELRLALSKPDTYATYFFRRVNVLHFLAEKTHMGISIHNLVNGQLPRRMFVMMVDHKAFSGSTAHDPYKFQNCSINEISAFIDGVQFPDKPFKPDFTKRAIAREYRCLFESLQQDNFQPVLQLKRDEFIDGKTIFAFNFAPDGSGGPGPASHASLVKHGNLRLDISFSTALAETMAVLVYCEFDNSVSIDGLGNVITDFM